MASFEELQEYLADPHKGETRSMWRAVVESELGPEDRQKAAQMSPVVTRYLVGETTREQYESEIAALGIESVEDVG